MSRQKIVVILGPTASGKSDLAVEIALTFGGEVVSADSRQVYRGLDIGTGKITANEMGGAPHHLLDVADPREQYSVAYFKRDAESAIDNILARGKLPVLCGGTGLYIQAVVDNVLPPEIAPNEALRKKLARKTPRELFEMLQKIDPKRAATIEPKNPRRLVRAIEIASILGTVPALPKRSLKYEILQIGIRTDKETLCKRIETRLEKRLDEGMIAEAEQLHKNGLSSERMGELGLEYKYIAQYLQGMMTLKELKKELNVKIRQYARRQMTWFKRDARIRWFSLEEKREIFSVVEEFCSGH